MVRSDTQRREQCPFVQGDRFAEADLSPVSDTGEVIFYLSNKYWRKFSVWSKAKELPRPRPPIIHGMPAERRGGYWLATLDGSRLTKKPWDGFTFQFLTLETCLDSDKEPPTLLAEGSLFHSDGQRRFPFQACRITETKSAIDLRVHCCAIHDPLVEIVGFPLWQSTNRDLEIINAGLKLFRYPYTTETTGALPTLPNEIGQRHMSVSTFEVAKSGRRKGSRGTQTPKYSATKLRKLTDDAINFLEEKGETATRGRVAQRLGFPYAKAHERAQRSYGDKRRWGDQVREAVKLEFQS